MQLRPPPDTALPLFIAFLRHGHEVGGDAVSEVKTIPAAAIGPGRESRPRDRDRVARSLAAPRCQSETYDPRETGETPMMSACVRDNLGLCWQRKAKVINVKKGAVLGSILRDILPRSELS